MIFLFARAHFRVLFVCTDPFLALQKLLNEMLCVMTNIVEILSRKS